VARTGDLIATTEVLIIPIRNEIEFYPRIRQFFCLETHETETPMILLSQTLQQNPTTKF
jgi:hypothetical protein